MDMDIKWFGAEYSLMYQPDFLLDHETPYMLEGFKIVRNCATDD